VFKPVIIISAIMSLLNANSRFAQCFQRGSTMKKISLIFIIFMTASVIAAGPIDIINDIGDKKTTTVGDGIKLFLMTIEKPAAGYQENLAALKKLNVIVKIGYRENEPLRKGFICMLIANHLKLNNSLLYLIFKTERYAHRACAAAGLTPHNGSEWDKLSGEELIEIMGLFDKYMEDKK
jgi:hypothetical protein